MFRVGTSNGEGGAAEAESLHLRVYVLPPPSTTRRVAVFASAAMRLLAALLGTPSVLLLAVAIEAALPAARPVASSAAGVMTGSALLPDTVIPIPPLALPRPLPPTPPTEEEGPDGLVFRLREATPIAPPERLAPVAVPLGATEAAALFERLPPLEAAEPEPFRLPPRTPPPPRTGATIRAPFPPPDSAPPPTLGERAPLEVLRVLPEGETELAPHLSITFSRLWCRSPPWASWTSSGCRCAFRRSRRDGGAGSTRARYASSPKDAFRQLPATGSRSRAAPGGDRRSADRGDHAGERLGPAGARPLLPAVRKPRSPTSVRGSGSASASPAGTPSRGGARSASTSRCRCRRCSTPTPLQTS